MIKAQKRRKMIIMPTDSGNSCFKTKPMQCGHKVRYASKYYNIGNTISKAPHYEAFNM